MSYKYTEKHPISWSRARGWLSSINLRGLSGIIP